jgi:hypothetical protein
VGAENAKVIKERYMIDGQPVPMPIMACMVLARVLQQTDVLDKVCHSKGAGNDYGASNLRPSSTIKRVRTSSTSFAAWPRRW